MHGCCEQNVSLLLCQLPGVLSVEERKKIILFLKKKATRFFFRAMLIQDTPFRHIFSKVGEKKETVVPSSDFS